MITLEQVILLDEKIQKAVDTISSLRSENFSLKTKLSEYQTRIEELEVLIKDFKNDQGEIEEGILKALKQLDMVDGDKITTDGPASSAFSSESQPSHVVVQQQEQVASADPELAADVELETEAGENKTEEDEPAEEGSVELDIF